MPMGRGEDGGSFLACHGVAGEVSRHTMKGKPGRSGPMHCNTNTAPGPPEEGFRTTWERSTEGYALKEKRPLDTWPCYDPC